MKIWLSLGVVGIVLLGLVGYRWKNEAAEAKELEAQQGARRGQSPTVEIAIAAQRPMRDIISAVGSFESPFRATLSPRTAGRIVQLEVREGDSVSVGQTLVRIDPQEVDAFVMQQRASLSESQARLAEAEARYEATASEVDAQIRTAEAALARAQADAEKAQRNRDALIAGAESEVDDAKAQLGSAEAQVTNAAAEVRSARAELNNALARQKRVQELAKEGYVSIQGVEDAALQVESRRAALDVRLGQETSAKASENAARARVTAAEKRATITKQTAETEIKLAAAAVKQAEAALAQARANRSRTPAFRQNLRALEAGVAAANAELNQAFARRSDTELKAPFKGTVTSRNLDPGSLATPGQSILVIEATDWLYMNAAVPIESAAQMTTGMSAEITLDAFPERIFTGTVDRINRAAEPQSRQVEVKIKVMNADGDLRPGAFAKVQIIVGRNANATVIPTEAVKTVAGQPTVHVVNSEDEIESRTVKTGNTDKGLIEIKEGIKPGDRVVVLSYQNVRDSQKVQIAAERGAGP